MAKRTKTAERATDAAHAGALAYAAALSEVNELGRARWGEQWEWLPEYADSLRVELFGFPEIREAEKLARDLVEMFSNKTLRNKMSRIASQTKALQNSRPWETWAPQIAPLAAMADAFNGLRGWLDEAPTFTPWGDPRTCLAAHFDIGFDAATVMLWRSGLPTARDLALLSILLGFPKWETYAEKQATADEIIRDEARAMRLAVGRMAAIAKRDRAQRGER